MSIFSGRKSIREEDYYKKFQKHLKKVNEEVNESFDNKAVQIGTQLAKEVLEIINEHMYQKDRELYDKMVDSDDDTTYNFYKKLFESMVNEVAADIGNNSPSAGAAPDEMNTDRYIPQPGGGMG